MLKLKIIQRYLLINNKPDPQQKNKLNILAQSESYQGHSCMKYIDLRPPTMKTSEKKILKGIIFSTIDLKDSIRFEIILINAFA